MINIQEWGVDVSRETSDRLECYEALLKKWNPAINLVSKTTLENLRVRHILDSAQIFEHLPKGATKWVDLGSGGGFPGLVCAVLAKEVHPELEFHLVESDTRKAAFLMTVARETQANVQVHSERIEGVAPLEADVLSARALAPLDKLLEFSTRHMKTDGKALFLKGEKYKSEVSEAQKKWNFDFSAVPSKSADDAVILKIGAISRA